MSIYPHTCTIIRIDESLDDLRSPRRRPVVQERDVPCFVQPTTGIPEERNGQVGYRVTHKIFFATPKLSVNNAWVRWTDAGGNKRVMQYRARHGASAGLGIFWRANVEEISVWPENLPE